MAERKQRNKPIPTMKKKRKIYRKGDANMKMVLYIIDTSAHKARQKFDPKRFDSAWCQRYGIFKYYRLVNRYMSARHDLTTPEVELLLFLDAEGKFIREDYVTGNFIQTWNPKRWSKLINDGWIVIWRESDYTSRGRGLNKNIYELSRKGKLMVRDFYKFVLGEKDLPVGQTSPYYKNKRFSEIRNNLAINRMIKDRERYAIITKDQETEH